MLNLSLEEFEMVNQFINCSLHFITAIISLHLHRCETSLIQLCYATVRSATCGMLVEPLDSWGGCSTILLASLGLLWVLHDQSSVVTNIFTGRGLLYRHISYHKSQEGILFLLWRRWNCLKTRTPRLFSTPVVRWHW